MTDILNAIIMGLVEGATEFLPVSSTGHLILTGQLLNFHPAGDVFEVVIQAGAMLAVVWLYFSKLWATLIGLPKERRAQMFALAVLVAFLPAAVFGALLHDFIKSALFNPTVVALALVVGGVLMLLVERLKLTPRMTTVDDIGPATALKIGLFQCLAMIPGVSRSGATIIGALLLGVERKAAAEFSFYLAIPTLVGAGAYDFYKSSAELGQNDLMLIAIGLVTSFISAVIVIKAFIAWLGQHGFGVFAWYRIVLGLVLLALIVAGVPLEIGHAG